MYLLNMRKKKTLLLFLFGITVLSTIWFVNNTFGNGSLRLDSLYNNGRKGVAKNNVFTMASDKEHPANFEKTATESENNLLFIPEKTESQNNKPETEIEQREDNLSNQNQKDKNSITTKDLQEENGGEENLLDVLQLNDKKEWMQDNKICSQIEKEKFVQTEMHTPSGEVKIFVHDPSDDVHVSASLVEHGEWEPNLIQLVYSLLEKDDDLKFIDLGANIGVFSLAVANLNKQVIAVEPLSINVKRLCKSIDANEFEDFITIVHNALSDKNEKVKLGKDKGNVGGTFIAKDENTNKIQGSSVVGQYSDEVNTAKLDDLLTIPEFNLKKVIIKMDVEGWESHVLNGAERFFRKVDVQGILMEWMWHKTGTEANDIINFFANHGYEPVNPNGNKLLDVRAPGAWPVDILWRQRVDTGHTHAQVAKYSPNSSNQVTKKSTGVQMYRHDMTKWNLDDSMCRVESDFMLANMHTQAGDVKIYVHNPSVDVHVSGGLMRNGEWEPHLIQLMFSLLEADPSSQFIDLGANLGVFSLAVARYGRKVVAVEPLSINLQRFCRSIRDNHFEDKITVVTNALGNERETVSFGMDVGNIGGTFVLNGKNPEKQRGAQYGGQYQDKVLTAKVDDILKLPGFDFKKVVIKMDVEGYEHFALQGASDFFSKVDVQAVLMEWMWHKAGSGAEEIFKFYHDRGYEPFDPLRKVVLDTSSSGSWPIDVLWRKKQVSSLPQNLDKPEQTRSVQTNSQVRMYRRDMQNWVKDTSMCIDPKSLLKANMHTNAGDLTIFVHDPTVDIHVSGSLVRGGSWEPHLTQLMYSLLQQDSELQFIDLGANLGVFSLAVAKYGRRVLAVEPLSINLHRFCASITANGFESLITVATNALSDKRENVTFGKDKGNVGGTFVLNDKNMNKFSGSPVIGKYDDVVLSAMMDDILDVPGFNFKKVIMKIDVEGYEHHVLRAADKFFRTVDVQAVLMEWMWQKDGSSAQEIIQFFTRYNYEPFSPGSNLVLDTQYPGSWPVDVLWRRKKSGNPFKNGPETSVRKSTRHERQQPNAVQQQPRESQQQQPNAVQQQQQPRQTQQQRGQQSSLYNEGRGDTPESSQNQQDRSQQVPQTHVQKNQAFDHAEKTNQVSSKRYGVNFYRRDGKTWVPDDSSCSASGNFLKANLHTPAGDVTIYVHDANTDVHVSGGLLRNEAWEPHLIRLMFDLLNKDSQLQFMDLGANLGVFSLAVAKIGRRVFAAEPLSINLQRFCKSILANHFEDKITVVTNALSDKIEKVSFGKDHGNVGGTFVLEGKNMEKYSGSAYSGKYDDVVQTAKLDSFLRLPGFDFTKVIMKIDVEGYEHHVFKGAKKFFQEVDVQAVLMEWMWHKSGSDATEILNFFKDLGYEPINPNSNSRLEISLSQTWPVDVLWKKTKKTSVVKKSSKVSSQFTSGVQVYHHDKRQWLADDSVCLNLPQMTRGKISDSLAGPYTIFVYDPSVDQWVSGSILRDGGWETGLVNSVISLLKPDEDLQFVDLGANLGVYTLGVAKFGRNVIAVDPLTSNVQRMCNSIIENNLGSKITLIYNALSDTRGTVSLGKDEKNVGGTFVMDRSNANKVQGSNVNGKIGEDVVTAKLDDLLNIPGFNFKKIIMKMDVEGYEGYVLKGGTKFFEMVDVQAVFMEWMWLKSGTVTQEVLSFFTSRGYKPYIATSGRELRVEDATNWPVDMMWKK
ncbi:uncharacterized protein LOC143052357 isoform X1 [Mytilus galloprovincialis]|uniref:uncharacterized protein LOC143052357 isoform X1 n=2 Tax=Mytilus galloprovincialis TaxID=29158 RepID=UPI003F7C35AD